MAGIITSLRDLVPVRPLSLVEALRVAELQASRLLELSGISEPPVPAAIISGLPRLQVERLPLPLSGATQWSRGRWLILLNGNEPAGRQRFSLAHEFKHVLDNPFISLLYPDVAGQSRTERAEQICDYFAGCVLMPRAWVKRLYCDDGVQDQRRLARRFDVSPAAIRVRLLQIGLAEPTALRGGGMTQACVTPGEGHVSERGLVLRGTIVTATPASCAYHKAAYNKTGSLLKASRLKTRVSSCPRLRPRTALTEPGALRASWLSTNSSICFTAHIFPFIWRAILRHLAANASSNGLSIAASDTSERRSK